MCVCLPDWVTELPCHLVLPHLLRSGGGWAHIVPLDPQRPSVRCLEFVPESTPAPPAGGITGCLSPIRERVPGGGGEEGDRQAGGVFLALLGHASNPCLFCLSEDNGFEHSPVIPQTSFRTGIWFLWLFGGKQRCVREAEQSYYFSQGDKGF